MSSSNSPCAACKFLRRKCTLGCVFAPYFPPDQQQKFVHVHRVFGASNVAKLPNDISPAHREDAVNSLAYEAEARLRDPVYGCVGYISILQHRLKQVQHDLYNAKKELSSYIGSAALAPFFPHPDQVLAVPHHPQLHLHQNFQYQDPAAAAAAGPMPPFGIVPGFGVGMGIGLATGGASQILLGEQRQQQQQQQMAQAQLALAVAEAEAAAAREQEMMQSYERQQNDFARLGSGGFDGRGGPGLSQVRASVVVPAAPASGLALVPAQPFANPFHVLQQQAQQQQFTEQQQPHHNRVASEEGKNAVGPSS